MFLYIFIFVLLLAKCGLLPRLYNTRQIRISYIDRGGVVFLFFFCIAEVRERIN